jgi:hypothetical protein
MPGTGGDGVWKGFGPAVLAPSELAIRKIRPTARSGEHADGFFHMARVRAGLSQARLSRIRRQCRLPRGVGQLGTMATPRRLTGMVKATPKPIRMRLVI